VEREPRATAVTVHSTTQTEPEHTLHYTTHRHTKPREKLNSMHHSETNGILKFQAWVWLEATWRT